MTSQLSRHSEEKFLKLDGFEIYYCIVGKGPHVILLMQGSLMHCWHEFENQILNFDHDLFTIVVWDPPGYGKSGLEKKMTENFYYENAEFAYRFMKVLNFDRYSVCGVCSGGATCMILAARHPEVVRSLVLANTKSRLLDTDAAGIQRIDNPDNFPQEIKPLQYDLYGRERAIALWKHLNTIIRTIHQHHDGEVCSQLLGDIKCPTFVISGDKDVFVDPSHARYLHQNIKGSIMYVDPEGRHTFHKKKPEEFNKRVQEFLNQH